MNFIYKILNIYCISILIDNTICSFDLNDHQLQLVADDLDDAQCKQLLKLLYQDLKANEEEIKRLINPIAEKIIKLKEPIFDAPKLLEFASRNERSIIEETNNTSKITSTLIHATTTTQLNSTTQVIDKDCLSALREWNNKDGTERPSHAFRAILAQMGRPELANKLSKSVHHELINNIQHFVFEPFGLNNENNDLAEKINENKVENNNANISNKKDNLKKFLDVLKTNFLLILKFVILIVSIGMFSCFVFIIVSFCKS